ncbi:Jumping translocation breakpoint protein (JTB) family protein [Acanthocheilonema viteae]
MFEVLINRRFLLLGTVILVSFIFFACLYRLENVYDADFTLKKFVTWNIQQSTIKGVSQGMQPVSDRTIPKLPDHMCYKNEPFIVLERCIACSPFEQNAVKAAYCLETGFYDKVNCSRSKHLGLKPCYEKTNQAVSDVYVWQVRPEDTRLIKRNCIKNWNDRVAVAFIKHYVHFMC